MGKPTIARTLGGKGSHPGISAPRGQTFVLPLYTLNWDPRLVRCFEKLMDTTVKRLSGHCRFFSPKDETTREGCVVWAVSPRRRPYATTEKMVSVKRASS